jgi:hypothetical protein
MICNEHQRKSSLDYIMMINRPIQQSFARIFGRGFAEQSFKTFCKIGRGIESGTK